MAEQPPIGVLLKQLRESKGLSQRQFAKKCGLDRGYISQLESGKTVSITLRIAEKLAKGLDMSASVFLDVISTEDEDIRYFLINELPTLDDEAKSWLRHTIAVIRERSHRLNT